MDIIVGLPCTSLGLDSIWVIVDRLTKSTNFLPVHTSYSVERLARIYILEVVPLGKFVYNNSYHSSIQVSLFEVLYDRRCLFLVGWFESTKPRPCGIDLMQEALDHVRVIQDRLWTTQSRHQSYADRRPQPLRFSIGDRVFLCVSPMKGVIRFGRQGKLSPAIHLIFHVWMLHRYVLDESHVLQYDTIELDDHLSYIEERVAILARDVRKL
ncbi:uncharacterized protein LOC129869700 [Solanum dulcamara]|uniref:uncharacterized protein LOC129869700 n=1 Tax=Solanum dulcamara TaxID=45834 RepID=UPI002485FA94|nr:uncharacterized protein LOC129869700 [Solanum dulcamara]